MTVEPALEALKRVAKFLKDWDHGNPDGPDGWFYEEFRDEYNRIQAALSAPSASGSVPVGEPAQDMVQAGLEAYLTENGRDRSVQGKVSRIYRAMLAASPSPEPVASGEEKPCGTCGGRGRKRTPLDRPGSADSPCWVCNGTGTAPTPSRTDGVSS